jgi:hypothetical protein
MSRHLKTFVVVLYISLLISSSFLPHGEQQFSYLAKSFLEGRLDINNFPTGFADATFFNGNYYWPLGPFPAMLIVPLVYIAGIFQTLFLHRYIHWLLVTGVLYLIYKIARKLKFSETDSLILSFAFSLGSVFIGVSLVPWGWYYSQVVCTLLIFLAMYEHFGKRRYFVMGLIFACILLTRMTAFLGIVFILLSILDLKEDAKSKIYKVFVLSIPILVSAGILLSYNFIRFGNPFEQGYKYQIIDGGTKKARDYGLVSLKHIPGNLYYFLVAPPEQVLTDGQSKVLRFPFITYSDWGMGILFTSCFMLAILFVNIKNKINRNLLIASSAIAIPVFMYYGIGFRQFGYRYSLDFLPYLFLLVMLIYQKHGLTNKFKLATAISILLNIYLLFTKSYIMN